MKLSTSFLIIIAIQFNLIIFGEGTNSFSNTGLFSSIISPQNWTNAPVVIALFLLIGLVIASGTVVGSFVFGKSNTILFAGAIALFLGWMVPITTLFTMIYKENIFGVTSVVNMSSTCPSIPYLGNLSVDAVCSSGTTLINGNSIFAGFIVAPLFILMIWSLIGWWYGYNES